MAWPPRKSKSSFKNNRHVYDGRAFDSNYERAVYDYLKILELTGGIRFLRQQCTIKFEPLNIGYRADFEIEEKLDDGTWRRVLVEAKGGWVNETWPLKLKMYRAIGPCPLWLFTGMKNGQPKLIEIVMPLTYVHAECGEAYQAWLSLCK